MNHISTRRSTEFARRTITISLLFVSPLGRSLTAQQASPAPVPSLLTQSISAMSGSVQLTDVTLTGTVDSGTKSGHESGTITLRATATGAARVDLQLPSHSTSEVAGLEDSRHYGNRQEQGGDVRPLSLHNLFVDPAWFAPVMTLMNMNLAAQKEASVVLMPSADGDPSGTAHLRFSAVPSGKTDVVNREVFRVSREDIFINATTLAPSEIRFDTHPEQTLRASKPVKIEYLSYATFSGVLLPSHIRKTMDNNPHEGGDLVTLDIVITSVSVNSGVTDASLQLQ